jgi:undecaprenyl diphosphate synthase
LVDNEVPQHIGIIMDGNGRWAKQRNLKRSDGHVEGAKTTKRIVKAVADHKIKYLSLYTFSTENWQRSAEEVEHLMWMIRTYLRQEYKFYHDNNMRIIHSGNRSQLSPELVHELEVIEKKTAHFTGLTINLLINYGAQDEFIRAVQRVQAQQQPFTIENITSSMDQVLPPIDLVLRTAGEQRLSNFMLWQAAYAELVFSPVLWPDFTEEHFSNVLNEYSQRQRRFGG